MKQKNDWRDFNNLSLRKKVKLRRLMKCIDIGQLKQMSLSAKHYDGTMNLSPGFVVTDMYGTRDVICRVVPDDEMPTGGTDRPELR